MEKEFKNVTLQISKNEGVKKFYKNKSRSCWQNYLWSKV